LRGVFVGLFICIFFSISTPPLLAQSFHGSFTDESSLCENCHKALQEYKGKYDKYCLFCHDGAIAPDVRKSFSGKYRHLQGKGYQCLSCHSPHVSISENPYLLKLKGKENNDDYCVTCHFEDETRSANFLAMYKSGFHSKRIRGEKISCLNCHVGHSSEGPNLLKEKNAKANSTSSELCFSCHQKVTNDFKKSSNHPLEREGFSGDTSTVVKCVDCHNPHFARPGNPLASWGVDENLEPVSVSSKEYEVCFKCHSSYVVQPPFQLNLKTLFDSQNTSYHPLLAKGKNSGIKKETFVGNWSTESTLTCSDCHGSERDKNVHGSSNPFLLKSFIDLEEPPQGKEICFACHNQTVYLTTSTWSRFSSHGLHSEKFSCLICHEPHGSSRRALIRESFIYSGKSYRLIFGSNDKDGSCGTVPVGACHNVLTYKREY
jgi:predicted CXXCH cytochrome family protein